MCGVFGFLDSKHQLTLNQRNSLVRMLALESEIRGSDATGIAYNYKGKMIINKTPITASKMWLHVPDTAAVLGHTRQATQGNAQNNYNNHPFYGTAGGVKFAFAHNGIILNDAKIRKSEGIPKTKIETDSYVAVQLIEKENIIAFDTLKVVAEKTFGAFVYTILDERNNFWFVKDGNPIALYCFDNGLIVYASTARILNRAMKRIGWDCGRFEQVKMNDGDILRICADGSISSASFKPRMTFSHCDFLFDDFSDFDFAYDKNRQRDYLEHEYKDEILDCVKTMGMSEFQIALLLDAGFSAVEIGDLIYEPDLLADCINEILCDF